MKSTVPRVLGLLAVIAAASAASPHTLSFEYAERQEAANATLVAMDGNTLKEARPESETFCHAVELDGYLVADKNSPCGYQAWVRLAQMMESGLLHISDDLTYDELGRAHTRATYDGRNVAEIMVRDGLGRASDDSLRHLEEEAAAEQRGCVWQPDMQTEWETRRDDDDEGEGEENTAEGAVRTDISTNDTTSRQIISSTWPTGFRTTRYGSRSFARPVDLIFPPGRPDDMIVAENKGRIYYVRDGRVLGTPAMDVRPIIASYQDRGIMSMAVAPDFAGNPWLYLFLVWEHDDRPAAFEGPKSSSVMKVRMPGTREVRGSRTIILGRRHGGGCGAFGPEADCIPTEGRSHVGGALGFNSRGELFVGVGDGAIAIITPVAHRSQMMGIYSGKILRINQDGEAIRSNPFFDGDVDHRNSKIWALGFRNPLHLHVSPSSDDVIYVGDTQWHDREEVNVVRRGNNMGWPCYEATLRRSEFASAPVCRGRPRSDFDFPLVSWPHADSAASMIGPRISLPRWPTYYRSCIVYGDIAANWIGFARVTDGDRLVEDLHRINIPSSIVQARAGPDGNLYYADVTGSGGVYQVSYTPDRSPLRITSRYPGVGAALPRGSTISMTFSRSLDPRYAAENARLFRVGGGRVAARVEHEYLRNTIEITPRAPLAAGTYEVRLSRDLRSLDGVRAAGLTWRFRSGGGGGPAPPPGRAPTITRTAPRDRRTGVRTTTAVAIYFDTPMRESSLSTGIRIFYSDNTASTVEIMSSFYEPETNIYRFRPRYSPNRDYTVVVEAGDDGVLSATGEPLAREFRFSYRTGDGDGPLRAVITRPATGTSVTVGGTIPFAGTATLRGATVPASAMSWTLNTVHCSYGSDACHDHTTISRDGVRSGTFSAIDHEDEFRYEVTLSVDYRGEQAYTTLPVAVDTRPIRLRSRPTGARLSLNGYTAAAPIAVDVAVNSEIQLSAPARHRGRAFARWSCGRARMHTRTMPDRRFVCTAVYE